MDKLTTAEVLRGWVEWRCPAHGFLAAASPNASVRCLCGKPAKPCRNGRTLHKRDLTALAKLQTA